MANSPISIILNRIECVFIVWISYNSRGRLRLGICMGCCIGGIGWLGERGSCWGRMGLSRRICLFIISSWRWRWLRG